MYEEVDEGTETLDDTSIETEDLNVEPDQKDMQIANLNKALRQEREQNKRLKQSFTPAPKVPEPNEEGLIDPLELTQSIEQRTSQNVQQILADDREWNKTLRKYPEIEDDTDLEDAIKGYKAAALINRGEIITYQEAADKLLGKFKKTTDKAVNEAKEQGRAEAQVSERIQERAGITEPSGGKEDTVANTKEQLRKILFNPGSTDRERDAARIKLIEIS